jgi:hypothetical protein
MMNRNNVYAKIMDIILMMEILYAIQKMKNVEIIKYLL